jgi:hypothetical protein
MLCAILLPKRHPNGTSIDLIGRDFVAVVARWKIIQKISFGRCRVLVLPTVDGLIQRIEFRFRRGTWVDCKQLSQRRSEMKIISPQDFIEIGQALGHIEGTISTSDEKRDRVFLGADQTHRLSGVAGMLEHMLEKMGLTASAVEAKRLQDFTRGSNEVYFIKDRVNNLRRAITAEIENQILAQISQPDLRLYDSQDLFGDEVATKLSSIQYDVSEAGNCLALSRPTACVFHLMRVMEIAVREFGRKLGLRSVESKSWQTILNDIPNAIKLLSPRDPMTIAMGEIANNLFIVKLTWRNQVMHPNASYTYEEAEDILEQVKRFMRNLATVL